jgi:tetratricopeptide (TPR) repeat protein
LLVQQAVTSTLVAMNTPLAEREAAWQAATAPLEEYLAQSHAEELELLALLQRGLVDLARGTIQRVECRPGDQQALEGCRRSLRSATERLGEVTQRADDLARDRALGKAGDPQSALDDYELRGVQRGTVLELARTYRQLGLTYPRESADRDDGLLQAGSRLTPIATAQVADRLAWQARIELLGLLAELDRASEAAAMLEDWANPPAEFANDWTAAVARVLGAAGNTARALETLAQVPVGQSAECDFARLELQLAAGDVRGAEQLLAVMRQYHSAAWARRATIAAGEQMAASESADATSRMAAGDYYYHAGQLARAQAAYDEAGQLSQAAGNAEGSRVAAERAAALATVARNWTDAARRFRALAFGAPTHPQAAIWHRERLLALASEARANPRASEPAAAFAAACREHLQHWPQGDVAHEVSVWLAEWQLAGGDYRAALDTTANLPSEGPHAAAATAVACQAYRQLATGQGDELTLVVSEASRRLQPLITGSDNTWPSDWSTSQRQVALLLAELRMRSSPPDVGYARTLLTRAIDGTPPPEGTWRAEATGLLAIALASGGDADAALERLAAAEPASDESSATLLNMLGQRITSERPDSSFRQPLARVIERVIDSLPAETTVDVRRYRALVLGASSGADDRAAAVALYRELVAERPRDGELHEEYAQLLAQGPGGDRQQAVAEWQRIESASQRGGERWYRARLARVRLLRVLGQSADADKLIALTKVLQPERGAQLERDAGRPE